MATRFSISEDELSVDDELGYPKAYATLCCNRFSFSIPYNRGPPATFFPYTLQPDEVARVSELDDLFPISDRKSNPAVSPRVFVDSLWKKLHHLGNAGFDPSLLRVDPYGNVLYYYADPSSPLAWKVDHWFPRSRGGLTVPSNLRIIQQQVFEKKKNKLEFLVPWWDLQLGISVNQFLTMFASSNSDFRQRSFSFLFSENPRNINSHPSSSPLNPLDINRLQTLNSEEEEDLQKVEDEVVKLKQRNDESRIKIQHLELRNRNRAEKCRHIVHKEQMRMNKAAINRLCAQKAIKNEIHEQIDEFQKLTRSPWQGARRRSRLDLIDSHKQLRTFLIEQKAYEAGFLQKDPCEQEVGDDGENPVLELRIREREEEEEVSKERGRRNMEKWLEILLENSEEEDEEMILKNPNSEIREEEEDDIVRVGRCSLSGKM